MDKYLIPLLVIHAFSAAHHQCTELFVQRVMSLMEELGVIDTNYNFSLYKHGPISIELEDALAELRSDGFLVVSSSTQSFGAMYEITSLGYNFLRRRGSVGGGLKTH